MPEKDKSTLTQSEAMEKILDRAIPKSLQARMAELEAEHESNYRLHPDKVAVWDISTAATAISDGAPGTYDVVTGSDKDREIRGANAKAEFTKQGLRITDRYEIVMNHIPDSELINKFTVIDRAEWEEYNKGKQPGMMSPAAEISGLMRRAGGSA